MVFWFLVKMDEGTVVFVKLNLMLFIGTITNYMPILVSNGKLKIKIEKDWPFAN